jgi:hypothetical protein
VNINTDLNILGGLPDWNLINVFLKDNIDTLRKSGELHSHTAIKTDKSVKRFEKAISSTLIHFSNPDVELMFRSILTSESISNDSLLLIFWNASLNNDLLNYLNAEVYFIAFYSGRVSIRQDEVVACLKDLKERENELKKWSDSTLDTTASKYLTLLKKFHLMHGSMNKTIIHPYLNDKMFVIFIYWLTAIESNANLLESVWLKYSFFEKPVFIERVLQKKFARFFQLNYTGDKLSIETTLPYSTIYDAIK